MTGILVFRGRVMTKTMVLQAKISYDKTALDETSQHNTSKTTPGTDKSKRIDQDQDRENEDKNQITHHSFLIRRL